MEATWCPVLTMAEWNRLSVWWPSVGPWGPSSSLRAGLAHISGSDGSFSPTPPPRRLPGGQAESCRLQSYHAYCPGHPEVPGWHRDCPEAVSAWRCQCQSQPGVGPQHCRPGQPFPFTKSWLCAKPKHDLTPCAESHQSTDETQRSSHFFKGSSTSSQARPAAKEWRELLKLTSSSVRLSQTLINTRGGHHSKYGMISQAFINTHPWPLFQVDKTEMMRFRWFMWVAIVLNGTIRLQKTALF